MIADGIDELETLDSWLAINMTQIRESQSFTMIKISSEPDILQEQLAEARAEYHKMRMLLADIKSFLTEERARQALRILHELTDLNGEERKILCEDAVKKIKRLHDQIVVIIQTIKQMIISMYVLRKSYSPNHG